LDLVGIGKRLGGDQEAVFWAIGLTVVQIVALWAAQFPTRLAAADLAFAGFIADVSLYQKKQSQASLASTDALARTPPGILGVFALCHAIVYFVVLACLRFCTNLTGGMEVAVHLSLCIGAVATAILPAWVIVDGYFAEPIPEASGG
jgi:hypothetical protein